MNQVSAALQFTGPQPYRMGATDYIRLIQAGGFGEAHVELVEGELLQMAPAGRDHGRLNADIAIDLAAICRPSGYRILIDTIVQLTERTVRAPDISVVDAEPVGRQHLLPSEILLAVEIAQSTLADDLGRKRIDYASAGIRHYWVVDVEGSRIHCHADPQGADYAAIEVVAFGEPVAVPGTDGAITIV
jgi:Uma2 family endonuclease